MAIKVNFIEVIETTLMQKLKRGGGGEEEKKPQNRCSKKKKQRKKRQRRPKSYQFLFERYLDTYLLPSFKECKSWAAGNTD